MGVSALQLGKSGLLSYQKNLDIIGANISNVSTSGYHNSRAEFSSILSRTLSGGSGSNGDRGGINPMQIGLGVQMSAISKNFLQGSLSQSGHRTDFGIEGKGFMPVATLNPDGSVPENGDWYLTRDGSMSLGMLANADGSFRQALLHQATGMPLLGIPGDELTGLVPAGDANGLYDPALLAPVEIPTDSVSPAEATTTVYLSGNVNAAGHTATQPAKERTDLYLGDGSAITLATDLVDLHDPNGLTIFNDLLTEPTIEVSMDIGGKTKSATFTYGIDGTNVADLGAFYESTFFDTTAVPPAGVEGASVQFLDDQLVLTGNLGTMNDISKLGFKQNNQRSSSFETIQNADGESTRFMASAFDSLGQTHDVDFTFVKESTAVNSGQTWRWYASSRENATGEFPVGSGTLSFDNSGHYIADSSDPIQISLDNGAVEPLVFNLELSTLTNLASEVGSDLTVKEMNGYAKGEFRDWVMTTDGTILGTYTNGQKREYARLPLLTLTNQAGLRAEGNNLYRQAENTGELAVRTAGTSIAGNLRQFTLEDSNVNLAIEMTKMIEAQRAFSSNSKVITTDQEVVDIALNLIR